MSENKNKYAAEAEQIAKAIRFGDFTDEWLENNGLSQKHLTLLDNMRRAKTPSAFNKAKLEFKKKIVRPFYEQVFVPKGEEARIAFLKRNPIMDFMSPKGLGSYDEIKKNEKVQNSKYATVSVNDKGEEVVNVPLLRMIEDPGELSDIAHYLDVDAEELRDHIRNEWKKKKEKEWKDEEKAMRNAIINGGKIGNVTFEGRKGVLKEFDNNDWSSTLKLVSPNVYAHMRRDIANGTGPEDGAEFNRRYFDDMLWDNIRNAGFAAATSLVPKVVTARFPAYATFAAPASTGVAVTANEWGALKRSPYYSDKGENLDAAVQSGIWAGTVPGVVGQILGAGAKVGSGALNHALRHARKVIYRGEKLPSVYEQERIYSIIDDAAGRVRMEANGKDVVPEEVGEAVAKVAEMLTKSPKMVIEGVTNFSDDLTREFLMTDAGVNILKKILTAPSKKTFFGWNSAGKNSADAITRATNQKAVRNTKELYPQAYEEINEIPENVNMIDKGVTAIAKGANTLGGIYEPITSRENMKESLSSYEANNPEQVEQWKRYGVPEWDPLAAEFKEKYGQPETVMGK